MGPSRPPASGQGLEQRDLAPALNPGSPTEELETRADGWPDVPAALVDRIGLSCRTFARPPAPSNGRHGTSLLTVMHGAEAALEREDEAGALRAVLPFPALADAESADVWSLLSPQAPANSANARALEHGPVRALRVGDVVAGAALYDADPLGPAVAATYRALLGLLAEEDVHLLRVWNAVPRINEKVLEKGHDLDRYMVFCRARSLALEEIMGRGFPTRLSAASAVGASGQRGIVLFLAARTPGERISNPRQEEAWRYPEQYGPRAPSFARATRLGPALGGGLLVSGTASIVGTESRHLGDPDQQLEETLSNLSALLRAAQSGNAQRPLEDLRLIRAYVKDPSHLARFQERLLPELARDAQVHWVEASICRPELFIEIEGLAR